MDRQGGEGKPATQPAQPAHLDTAQDAKEKLNRGPCHSLIQCLLERRGSTSSHPGCVALSHSCRARTEPAQKTPVGPSPQHKLPSPQQEEAVSALRLLHSRLAPHSRWSMYSKTFSVPSTLTTHGAKPAWSSTSSTSSSKPLSMQTTQSLSSAQHLRRSPQLREHSQCFQEIAPSQTLAM